MPSIENVGGGTVFKPSPYEQAENNKRKKQRAEHEMLMNDVSDIKKYLHMNKLNKSKNYRRKYY